MFIYPSCVLSSQCCYVVISLFVYVFPYSVACLLQCRCESLHRIQMHTLLCLQKKRGKSDSDDDFVPGKKGLSRKVRGRGTKKTLTLVNSDSASSDATDEFYNELFEPESEEEAPASSSWSDHIDSDGSEYMPRGRNAKRAAAIKGNFKFSGCRDLRDDIREDLHFFSFGALPNFFTSHYITYE